MFLSPPFDICLVVNYHPQRRWLEKIVLKGTIVFAVVT